MTTLEKANKAYKNNLPEWVKKLAMHIDNVGNQRKVADQIGYSTAAVSCIINNKYKAPTELIEQAVNNTLSGGVLRSREFRHTNPMSVMLARRQAHKQIKQKG